MWPGEGNPWVPQESLGAQGEGCTGSRVPWDTPMPPQAPAVTHSPDSWKPGGIRLGTGQGCAGDSSFGQQVMVRGQRW